VSSRLPHPPTQAGPKTEQWAVSKIISHNKSTNTYVIESTKTAYAAAKEVGLKNPRLITEYSVGNGVKHWILTTEK
jgi:hypothetical protein